MSGHSYNATAKALHWLIVILLIAQFSVAWTMPDITHDTKPVGLVAWHISIGLTILLMMLVRVVWLAISRVPPPPEDLPRVLRVLSRAIHFLLYAVVIVLPILGWANASARGWEIAPYGAFGLPSLAPNGSDWGDAMGDVHQVVAYVLLGLAGLHVAGALYHQFVLRDAVMRRMLPLR